MLSKYFILNIILFGSLVYCNIGVSPCPIGNPNGTIISGINHFYQGTIIVANNGLVPLVDGQDSQCYNYSLPYPLNNVPEVAVCNCSLIQLFMILKPKPVKAFFTLLSPYKLTAKPLYHLLFELNGSILDGLKLASVLLLKIAKILNQDIIK